MKPRRRTYLDGWKRFPLSCLGHHIQGVICGIHIALGDMLAVAALVYILGYVCYQFGSAWRKDVTGKIDSPGLDVIDLTVPAAVVAVLVSYQMRIAAGI